MTDILEVSLYGTTIGTITKLPSGGIFFAFDENYISASPRPVLSQSFFRLSGELLPETKITSAKLPPFFSNLLPEGHMRDYLAKRGDIKPSQEFKLIALLGEDLAGAVTIRQIGDVPAIPEETHDTSKDTAMPYRFSLAGVQLKFSAIAGPRGGLTIPAAGVGGDWIIKLPAQNYTHVPENEFAIMSLAAEIGIPIPEIRLVPLDSIGGLPEMGILAGNQALAVKRFDRDPNGQRIHIEDFAQVYNIYPDKKYEGVSYANIAGMVLTLTGEAGLADFIRRLTFCTVIGNGDMHLKNWSFIYEDQRTPALSPAYDLLSTVPYIPQDGHALKLGDTKDMQRVTLEQFKKMIKKAGLPEHLVLQTVQDTVEATLTAWNANRKHYDLPNEIKEHIQKHMDSISLKRK